MQLTSRTGHQPTHLMRARLNARLTAAARYPVTLIAAPAGFGKSVALRDFLRSSRLETLRYDVGRDDNTLLAFVRRLSEVLEPVAPSARPAFRDIQRNVLASSDPARWLADWLSEHLRRTVCTVVIDDLHYAAVDPASITLLAELIERTSERIKWILAARSDAGLPIASWIAYGRMDLPVTEDDLRFTYDEALAAAEEAQNEIDPAEVEALLGLTNGWPVALAIALRTRTYAEDLRSATDGTREFVYRYLAEQVFSKLTEQEREFMLRSSVFPEFDVAIAEQLGFSAETIERLRGSATFLTAVSPNVYRYHDLFREFLETELRKRGEPEWMKALCGAAAILHRRGSDALALQLYTKASDVENIADVLNERGLLLFEQGQAETIVAALDVLPESVRLSNAVALGLSAMLDAARDRFESAERSFRAAIDASAVEELRLSFVHRYAIELVRHERECVDFLKPYANDSSLPARWRVPLLGTLATALVRERHVDEALSTIERAFELLEPSISDDVRARLYQQAAYVHQFGHSRDRAKTYAQTAIEIALRRNLYEVAARAYSVLFWAIYDDDDLITMLEVLDRLNECARKAGSNQTRAFGLIAMYEIEAELGNEEALEQLERALQETSATLSQSRAEALLPGQGMRAAWHGDFRRACDLLQTAAQKALKDEQKAMLLAETALYAFASGCMDEGEDALQQAAQCLDRCTPSWRTAQALLSVSLAELTRGRSHAAHRHLIEAEKQLTPRMQRLRALAHAVRAIYRIQLEGAGREALSAALERMRAEHLGGMARLIEVLPFASDGATRYALLTPSERSILQLLVKGASTKDVAVKTARSPQTVDTHIRAICRKLQCSGRREAVALAVGSGWVE